MYPQVLNIIMASGRPGNEYPMISSVMTLRPTIEYEVLTDGQTKKKKKRSDTYLAG